MINEELPVDRQDRRQFNSCLDTFEKQLLNMSVRLIGTGHVSQNDLAELFEDMAERARFECLREASDHMNMR